MDNATVEISSPARSEFSRPSKANPAVLTPSRRNAWVRMAAPPLAVVIALAVHFAVGENDPGGNPRSYTIFLSTILILSVGATGIQTFWGGLHRWMMHTCPLIGAGVLTLALWEFITSGVRLLPLPYFPSPAAVVQSLVFDW